MDLDRVEPMDAFAAAGAGALLVDIRYVLWVMTEVDQATALLTEMGIR